MTGAADGETPHLAVVNGLRGWAIAGVVFHHAIPWYLVSSGLTEERYLAFRARHGILSNGFLGVNLFFVLSGFVLALPYVRGARTLSEPGGVRSFYLRRAARLLPLYYLAVLVGMFVRTESDYASTGFLREMVLLASFGFVFVEPYFFPRCNMALWSLGDEFWFSVLFPALWSAARRVGIGVVTGVALALCLAVRIHGASLFPGAVAPLNAVKDGVFGRLDDFVVGIAVCHLVARRKRPGRAAAVALVAAALALFLVACAGWNAVTRRDLPYGVTPYLANVVQASAALLLFGLLGEVPRALRLVFTAWPVQLLGMMCYSLYVWHPMGLLGSAWDATDLPVFLLLVFLISALTYRFVEFPKRTVRELFVTFPR